MFSEDFDLGLRCVSPGYHISGFQPADSGDTENFELKHGGGGFFTTKNAEIDQNPIFKNSTNTFDINFEGRAGCGSMEKRHEMPRSGVSAASYETPLQFFAGFHPTCARG